MQKRQHCVINGTTLFERDNTVEKRDNIAGKGNKHCLKRNNTVEKGQHNRKRDNTVSKERPCRKRDSIAGKETTVLENRQHCWKEDNTAGKGKNL